RLNAFAPGALPARSACNCFIAGTLVATLLGATFIEDVQLGERIHTYSQGADTLDTHEDLVRVELRAPNPFVQDDVMVVELLRPRAWLEEQDLALGDTLSFQFPRTFIVSEARVTSVLDAERPSDGDGHLVTGTFTSLRGDLVAVWL